MVKINFQNNITKANADTFNTMQDNIEDAINKIGTIKQAFGDIFTSDGTYTATIIGNVVGTYIGNGIWKIDYEGQIDYSSASGSYYDWGISITKINNLLGLNLENFTGTTKLSNFINYSTNGSLNTTTKGYASTYEYKSSINALLPARYYNTSGSIGGWPLSSFSSGNSFYATLYLKEQ